MLIKNDKKGYFGSFSEIGRRAARMNFLISKNPLSPETRKKYSFNESLVISAFEASENKNKYLSKKGEDNFDIFTIDEAEKIRLEELAKGTVSKTIPIKKNQINNNKSNTLNEVNNTSNINKFKYHKMNKKKKEKILLQGTPPCTKYNPKYTSIFRRSASSPPWGTLKGRDNIFDGKIDEHPFYIEHKNILDTMAGKAFIDMKKQKQIRNKTEDKNKDPNKKSRPSSSFGSNIYSIKKNKSVTIGSNDKLKPKSLKINNIEKKRPFSCINARMRRKNYSINLRSNISAFSPSNSIINDKKYSNNNFILGSNSNNKMKINISRNKIIEVDFNKSSTRLNNSNDFRNKSEIKYENSKEPIDISEDSYELYKNIYKKEIIKKRPNNFNKTYTKKIIKGPNFKQMISREALDKLKDDKIPIVPYLLPNFSSVRGRPIMMVVYDRKYHKINRNKSDTLARIDNTFYYDPNEILTKINNYVSSHPPNFNMMTSRPDDDDPLPSYMKRIYTRNGCYDITQLSLKLNNYKNRGFAKMHSSFFPKKSFNKIINLNLLKSKKFLNNVIGDEKLFYRQFKGLGPSLKFYNKNYEDILRDNFLERFDNVTYKSIKKEHSQKILDLVNKIKEETGDY